jgi:multiple sugar transport system ATP-binding protein
MAALSIRNVTRHYGAVQILKGIDIEVDSGEFLILVGPSGCGKSTLLNIIAGLDVPTSGTVHIAGRDVTNALPKDRDIAMVFQSYALYPNMNVAQNIAFGLEMRNVPKPQREAAIARVSKMLQIEHLLDRKPGQLSGGQRQRVAMGRALARDPTLFLFDEPLSNLDAKLRVEMRAEIKHLHHRAQVTTVYVTHDQIEAMTLGDHIAVMKGGVIEQYGSPDDIYSRPATRFVAEFIGSPAMNIVAGTPAANGYASHGIALDLTERQRGELGAPRADGILYGMRPEALSFADAGLPGTISLLEPTGPETYALVETPMGKLMARVPGKVHQQLGDNVFLRWHPEDAHLFDAGTERRIG